MSEEESNTISKETKVTLGVVVLIIGGVIWLTTIQVQARSNSKKLNKIETQIINDKDDNHRNQTQILEKLSVISGDVQNIYGYLKGKKESKP